ncbi:MAG: hypothetical protein H6608_09015 [Flavobacteriales bacterium]|nr:hypothetical protein [Bacteroidota bacterium]MCB9241261.1 hypothetical protein [Flavobacteriales bacterium]
MKNILSALFILMCWPISPALAQEGWTFSAGVGTTLIMPNYRLFDGVERRYRQNDLLGATMFQLKGLNPYYGQLTVGYQWKQSTIQFGWERRHRIFTQTIADYDVVNGKAVFDPNSLDYWTSANKEFFPTMCFPIQLMRTVWTSANDQHEIRAGLGFCVNYPVQGWRKRQTRYLSDAYYTDSVFGKNQIYVMETKMSFVNEADWAFDISLKYSISYLYKTKKHGNWELLVSFLDNPFETPYEDALQTDISFYFLDVTDPDNPIKNRESPVFTNRFYLKQGGLDFCVRYYPQRFKINSGIHHTKATP